MAAAPEADFAAVDALIAAPLALVASTFADACAAAGAARGHYDASWVDGVATRALAVLSSDAALARVPLLNAASLRGGALRANTLVRFVGMVQDAADPEWFAAWAAPRGGARAPCAFADALPAAPPGAPPAELSMDVLERRCGRARGRARRGRRERRG